MPQLYAHVWVLHSFFSITYFYIALSKTYYSRFKRKKLLNGYFKDFHDHNENTKKKEAKRNYWKLHRCEAREFEQIKKIGEFFSNKFWSAHNWRFKLVERFLGFVDEMESVERGMLNVESGAPLKRTGNVSFNVQNSFACYAAFGRYLLQNSSNIIAYVLKEMFIAKFDYYYIIKWNKNMEFFNKTFSIKKMTMFIDHPKWQFSAVALCLELFWRVLETSFTEWACSLA